MRARWEETWDRPSRGHFEDVPMALALEDLLAAEFRRLLAEGKPIPTVGAGEVDERDPVWQALHEAANRGDDPFSEWVES